MNTRALFYLKETKELTKAVLSLYNAGVCTLMYCHGCPSPTLLNSLSVMSGSFLMACSTQALNQAYEAPIDKIMTRTMRRPIPSGTIPRSAAVAIGLSLGGASLALLAPLGYMTQLTALSIWSGYLMIYTPLKRVTRFSTHIGSIAGAAPVYLGWVAGTGTFYGLDPFLMGLFMAAWQFPHFYGILWTYKQDFLKGGYKMITNVDPNGIKTSRGNKIAALSQLFATIGMGYTGMIHPLFVPVAIWYNWTPVKAALEHFQAFPNAMTGHKLTIVSYRLIGTLFLVLFGTIAWRKAMEWVKEVKERTDQEHRKYEDYKASS
ncbi:COX10 [Blepharisma stoltei]|uniref:Protoheme IX farnesyltransferase, mitochondrial n=1 Tax=Blepharisma stoltei TaxID=1481888 RepID=A0AAU9J8B5_9CILI|nr:unnamed protein product [Blepharisma stoltei]